MNEGLPSGSVYDVHTDELGYLWFATANGLVRHDGANYEVFGSKQGLKDDLIFDIYFENPSVGWVSSEFGGVAKFENLQFEYLEAVSALDTMVVNYITGFNNKLWFGTNEHGVWVWDKEQERLTQLTVQDGLPSNQIWEIESFEDQVWISSMFGIATYIEASNSIETIVTSDELNRGFTYQVVKTSNNELWVATDNGVAVIDSEGEINLIEEINGVRLGFVFSIVEDKTGDIWIGTERQGLFIYGENSEAIQIKKSNGLSSNFIYRLIKDEDGTIWVATDGDGVSVFRDRNFKFYGKQSGLNAVSVYASTITKDGTLWLGTDKGLVKKDGDNFITYTIPEPYYQEDEIWEIEELPNGNLLVLTYTYELLEFDGARFFQPVFYDELVEYYINDIKVVSEEEIYFSTFGYLIRLNPINNSMEIFETPDDEYWMLSLGYIFVDTFDNLWISTDGGIARFKNDEFEFYTSKDGVLGKSIYEIAQDPEGNLWLGSNLGITVLKNENLMDDNFIFEPIFEDDLLTKETVFLLFDNYGGLWQGTNAGLNYVHVKDWDSPDYTFNHIHFALTDYGNGIEFNGAAREMDEDGVLWFGTDSDGLVSFEFDENTKIVSYKNPPEVYLRSISSNDSVLVSNWQGQQGELTFDSKFNDLEFNINATEFKNPNMILYSYRLNGFDSDWNTDIDIDEIRYTNLDPGTYTLYVKAKSTKSAWSTPNSLVTFRVKKPFIQSIWFRLVLILVFITILIGFIKSRISRLEKAELKNQVDKRTKDLQKALDEKEVLIKEIHHRVKNNLAVVSGLLELQGFKIPQGPAKQALVESRMRVITMSKVHENLYQNSDLANVDFKKFINDLIKGIHSTYNHFERNIEVIQYIDELSLNVNQGVPIGLITNELVSNCYKHAFNDQNEGTITISFEDNEQDYVLEVKDNGKGSEVNLLEVRKKSLGMTLVKSLASQIRADIRYEGVSGSCFTVTIPKEEFN